MLPYPARASAIRRLLFRSSLLVLIGCAGPPAFAEDEVRFARDIQPVLARKCFACHGPDEEHRAADLRLDIRSSAVEAGALDESALADSSLLERVLSDDPDFRMPPPDSRETLTDDEKQKLRAWVLAGAEYQQHWAFVPPEQPQLPEVGDSSWPRNEIDRFILHQLQQADLTPSPTADKYTLVRRVYLDLVGVPPTPEQADAFVNDPHPDAWEHLIDRLLQSERYGERWARLWLDLARYADTNGYEKDRPRSIWPYRDWVIRALNADMPYDQFTVEQLAGDMLPQPTDAQRIATGFHRNTMLNEEGGIDPLEFRFYAMVDRVATTGTVWLGLTTGCAQCHTHKYDPILHTDFYRLMALMDNADEPDLFVRQPDITRKQDEIRSRIRDLEARLPEEQFESREAFELAFDKWLRNEQSRAVKWTDLRPTKMETNLPRLELLDDNSILSTGDITKRDVFSLTFPIGSEPITALRLEAIPNQRLPANGPGRAFYEGRKGDFFLSEVSARANGRSVQFSSSSSSIPDKKWKPNSVFDKEGSSGWALSAREGEAHQLVLNLAEPLTGPGAIEIELLFERHYAASLGRFRFSGTSAGGAVAASTLPVEVEALLTRPLVDLSEKDRQILKREFLRRAPQLAEARKPIDALRKKLPDFPTTLVMQERPADNQRTTHRHHRGEYLSPREAVPAELPSLFRSERPVRTRLQFAKWLVSPENPLAARVAVNRAWRAFFGNGIVKTSGDFGTQSEPPSHPELLDWLAVEFMQRGWSMKSLHRLIVTSATYRQASRLRDDLRVGDPENRLLGRMPRTRVDAEFVRDMMLTASGLLSEKMYGPGVYPPQPASVTALAYGSTKWNASTGEDRYRRSLYTFAKRTAPFAAFTVFDGPSGENCLARRNRSNTPLQALTLLNDEMFLEMSRAAAAQIMDQEATNRQRAARLFRSFVTRPPDETELTALTDFFRSQLKRLESGSLDTSKIGGPDATPEIAAWTMVARTIMNLDEVITRP